MNPDEFQSQIRSLSPYDFEKYVANIWEKSGWQTSITAESNDRGIDIVAEKEPGYRELLQVKRYGEGTKVGSQEVRNYATLYQQEDEVDSVGIVTSSEFTDPGRELAHDLNVRAIDYNQLYHLAKDSGAFEDLEKSSITTSKIEYNIGSEGQRGKTDVYIPVLEQMGELLNQVSDYLDQASNIAETSEFIAEFAFRGSDNDLRDVHHIRSEWIRYRDSIRSLTNRYREIPVEKLPEDYRPYHTERIGHFELFGDKLTLIINIIDRMINLRLPEESRLEVGQEEDFNPSGLNTTSSGSERAAEELTDKLSEELENIGRIINSIRRMSEEGDRVITRFTEKMNSNPEDHNFHT